MRVESVPTTVYIFTKDERDYLIQMGIWTYIYGRLMSNERVEVE